VQVDEKGEDGGCTCRVDEIHSLFVGRGLMLYVQMDEKQEFVDEVVDVTTRTSG